MLAPVPAASLKPRPVNMRAGARSLTRSPAWMVGDVAIFLGGWRGASRERGGGAALVLLLFCADQTCIFGRRAGRMIVIIEGADLGPEGAARCGAARAAELSFGVVFFCCVRQPAAAFLSAALPWLPPAVGHPFDMWHTGRASRRPSKRQITHSRARVFSPSCARGAWPFGRLGAKGAAAAASPLRVPLASAV